MFATLKKKKNLKQFLNCSLGHFRTQSQNSLATLKPQGYEEARPYGEAEAFESPVRHQLTVSINCQTPEVGSFQIPASSHRVTHRRALCITERPFLLSWLRTFDHMTWLGFAVVCFAVIIMRTLPNTATTTSFYLASFPSWHIFTAWHYAIYLFSFCLALPEVSSLRAGSFVSCFYNHTPRKIFNI